jgi:E3 ubiquitin-protein ligase listerin
LQGYLTVSSGKRIAPQLPNIVGAWLSGTFDSDKSVSRAALESFGIAFPALEKRKAVWRLYQQPLLEYVEDAVLRQTPQTLSDERNTSPDDAEAKYVRVVSTSLLVLDQLVQTPSEEKALDSNETFQVVINAKKTYEFGYHEDSSIRRAIYKLVGNAIDQKVRLDWKLLSSCFLAKSLSISQASSSAQFVIVLVAMTQAHPSVWTSEYASKTAISHRLHQYLKKGSQRGPEAWWSHLRELIKSVPTQAWSTGSPESDHNLFYESASQLLNALHEGVVNGDEPRQNATAAWKTYADIFLWTLALLREDEERNRLVQIFFYPIIERYLLSSSDLSDWAVPASTSLALCSSNILTLESTYPSGQFAVFYQSKVDSLIEAMRLSLPESSKNFKSSQDDLIQKARRFVDLQNAIDLRWKDGIISGGLEPQDFVLDSIFMQSNLKLLGEAVKVLHDRNGKPYGAAGIIYIILDKRPGIFEDLKSSSASDILSDFLSDEAPRLLESPSAELLVSILLKCRHVVSFDKSFNAVLGQFLGNKAARKSHAYSTFLRGITSNDLSRHPELEQELLQDVNAALNGDNSRWAVIYEILSNQNVDQTQKASDLSAVKPIQSRLLEDMLSGLALEDRADNALKGFDILFRNHPSVRQLLASHVNLGSLLTRLLLMSDSNDEGKAEKAARLASLVKKVFAHQGDMSTGTSAVELFARQLDGEGEALSILLLVDIAREALQDAKTNGNPNVASALCPKAAHWEKALTPFLQLQPPISMSLITPLQGCAFVVDRQRRRSSGGLPRDSEGFSVAIRLTILVTRLLEDIPQEQLAEEQLNALYLYYPQALQLAYDKLSMVTANALWVDSTEEVIQEMTDILESGQKLIHSWLVDEKTRGVDDERPSLVSCWSPQLSNIDGASAQTYNLARTFATVMTEAADLNGASRFMPNWDSSIRAIRSSSNTMRSAALLAVCRESLATSALGKRLCNELVADATDIDFEDTFEGECFRFWRNS